MKKKTTTFVLAAAAATATLGTSLMTTPEARADVTLPGVISDNMILQRNAPVRIWGKADPGERVTVTLMRRAASATAGPDGKWSVTLPALPAGGPFDLIVRGKNTRTVKNVLVGEVWVASGQSNMEFSLAAAANAATEVPAANDPNLRMFTVTKAIAAEPRADVAGGSWQSASPQTARAFSAVGYFFAKALRKALNVPVGVIHTSWGGTRIEAWTSKETLIAQGVPLTDFGKIGDTPEFRERLRRYERQAAAWKAAGSPAGVFADPGMTPEARSWWSTREIGGGNRSDPNVAVISDAGIFTDDWATVRLPGAWEQSGVAELEYLDGAVWFRKIVNVPSVGGHDLTLSLGAIDDHDTTYFNGVKIGGLGAETPNVWQAPRWYTVPGRLVEPGRNTIAVRVWDGQGGGGLTGPATEMYLEEKLPPGVQTIAAPWKTGLAGDWRYKVERGRVSDPGGPPSTYDANAATGLYNAMLAPVLPYTIKGAIWYQGESNAGDPAAYRRLFPAMIRDWRKGFGVGDFTFLAVQLAPFMAIQPQPSESSWAALRESQVHATHVLPNVGVAVITDVGQVEDIHPSKKQPAGERLALLARKIAYGEKNLNATGPTLRNMTMRGGEAVLTFDNVGPGLTTRAAVDSGGRIIPADKLTGFAVAGSDGKFAWAEARIAGPNTVVVSAPQVTQPVAVRFGWADYPLVNLWSGDGLPAGPFRTDAPK